MTAENAVAKNEVKSYCYNIVETMDCDVLLAEDRKLLLTVCTQSLEWVLKNQEGTKKEYETRLEELKNICEPLLARAYENKDAGAVGLKH